MTALEATTLNSPFFRFWRSKMNVPFLTWLVHPTYLHIRSAPCPYCMLLLCRLCWSTRCRAYFDMLLAHSSLLCARMLDVGSGVRLWVKTAYVNNSHLSRSRTCTNQKRSWTLFTSQIAYYWFLFHVATFAPLHRLKQVRDLGMTPWMTPYGSSFLSTTSLLLILFCSLCFAPPHQHWSMP